MSELTSVLDALAAVDADALPPEEQLEFVATLAAGANRLTATLTSAVRAAERKAAHQVDGAVSMKAWLRGSLRLDPAEATAIVTTGRRLEQLPAVAAAHAAGDISPTHARVITKALNPKRLTQADQAGIDTAVTDQLLADLARRTGPQRTAAGVRRWVAGIDADGALDDAADTARRFTMAPGLEGRVFLREHVDAVGAEYLHTALAALMNADRPSGDTRSHAERQGDALVALARGMLDGGGLPTVRGERPPARPGHHRPDRAVRRPGHPRRHRRRARLGRPDHRRDRLITGPDGLPLDTGREQRTASAGIRRAVEHRDQHCVFAGCDAVPEWCDVHHVRHWAHGGDTSVENSALLCERHHTACHEGRFRVHRDPGTSTWRTYRPDGSQVTSRAGP